MGVLKNQDIQLTDKSVRETFVTQMKDGEYSDAFSTLSGVDDEKILNADKMNDITSATDYGLTDLQTTALNDGYIKPHRIFLSYRAIDDDFITDFNIVTTQAGEDVYFRFPYFEYNTMAFEVNFGGTNYGFRAIQGTTWRSYVSTVFNEMLDGHTMFRISPINRVEIWDMGAITPDFVPLVDSNNNFVYADDGVKNAVTETYAPYVQE